MRAILVMAVWASAALAQTQVTAGAPPLPVDRAELGRSQNGGAGLDRVQSAEILPRTISASGQAGFFRQQGLTAAGTDEYHLGVVGASFAPTSFVELSLTSRSATLSQPAASPENEWLVNDLTLGAKVGSAVGANVALAAQAGVRLPPPLFRTNPVLQGASPYAGGLLTVRGGQYLRMHVNSSFLLDNSVAFDDGLANASRQFALGITTFNQWKSGAAVEGRIDLGDVKVNPFVEYTLDVPLGAAKGLAVAPMRLTPGVRVLPWRGLFIDGAVELGLTRDTERGVPVTPAYLALLSVGYELSLDEVGMGKTTVVERVVEKERVIAAAPTKGTVKGVVKDAGTGKPIADAVVSIPGRNKLLADASGTFVASDVDPGTLEVGASLLGYAPKTVEGNLRAGSELDVALLLTALPPPPVIIKGTVISEKEQPLDATVEVPTAGLPAKGFASGEFSVEVPPGEQSLEVSAKGYLRAGKRIVAKSGETVVADFVLKEQPKLTLVILKKEKIEIKKQVHFATNRDVILPDSSPLLDQVAATILENDRLHLIRIEGHTDSQGDDNYNLDLSNRRAQSVVRSLIDRGVDPKRLKAIGYGETKPIADNKKASGRAQNRRVEFMIEEQD